MRGEVIQERMAIAGPLGKLSAELAYPVADPAFSCLLLNPHPHMGGCMDNPLIVSIATAIAASGGVSLRFDYSGVGLSEGPPLNAAESMASFWATGRAPEDPRMMEDAAAALAWLTSHAPSPRLIVGYSFGASVAAAIVDPGALAFVLISPTLPHHDFAAMSTEVRPILVVYSDNDFATPMDMTLRFIDSLSPAAVSRRIGGAEHFFRKREAEVARIVVEFSAEAMNRTEALPCN